MQSKELEQLFSTWKEKENHKNEIFNFDGIVCPEEWDKQDLKILFLLKEAYHDDEKYKERTQSNEYRLAEDLCHYGPWHSIWNRVAEWTYGILNTTKDDIFPYKKLSWEQANDCLKKIAVMNIKKSRGVSASNDKDLKKYAIDDAAEILAELEIINPDIIVCGYSMGYLIEALNKQKENNPSLITIDKKGNYSENYHYRWKDRIVLDYYHPAAQYPALMSYYGLVGCYKDALRK